ncbi:protein rolling stone-like isoform X1 [Haliotis rufescens]|uniref:protein rolling stone-like isoform X1 n=2 Tax=Haliotis rufescens TaxID=6454 RepID=UPI00201E9C64|nr:protein rolling stone-like isoform X1 [Haliotis rufescens]
MPDVRSKLRVFLRQLSPLPENIEPFTKSQWRWCSPIALAMLYGIMTIYTLNGFILWCKSADLKYDVGVFLTTWSYCTVFLHFLLSAIIVCTHHVSAYYQRSRPSTAIKNRRGSDVFSKQDGSPDTNDILHEDTSNSSESNTSTDTRWRIVKRVTISISWISTNIVFVFVIVVTAVYYTAMCPKDVTCGRYFNINVHALNTVFIIVDVVISGRPVRMCHVVYPFIFGFIYVMFSVFFWASDHTHVIYRVVLNWNKPGMTAGVLIGASIGIVLLHALHLGIYKLKLYVHKRVSK